MRKRFAAAIVAVVTFAALFLCACSGPDGDIPGKQEVEKKVRKDCPTEKIELVSVGHEDALPKKDTYHYQSQQRNLTFETISTLRRFGIDASESNFYSKSVECNYARQVLIWYEPAVADIKSASGLVTQNNGNDVLCVSRWADIDRAVDAVMQVQAQYATESTYNTQDWIRDHLDIKLAVYGKAADGKLDKLATVGGVDATANSVRFDLQMQYARAEAEGRIPSDPDIPGDVRDHVHVQHLGAVYMKGVPMDDRMANQATGAEYNLGKDVFVADYDYEFDDYMVKIDVGIAPIECGPHALTGYVEWSGSTLNMDYGKGKGSWTVDGQKFILEATKGKDDRVGAFSVKKDGTDMHIPWKQSPRETYMVLVPAKEMARMLGLSAHADEHRGILYFE